MYVLCITPITLKSRQVAAEKTLTKDFLRIHTHTHICHIHIIIVSHKNYSWCYILHFLKKVKEKIILLLWIELFFPYPTQIIICHNVFSFQLARCPNCRFYVKQELCILEMFVYV